ncbi:potassium/sodium hyperpolarization-activated cyclic nucleotide-gated channel 4-like isoform X1 [Lytechinus pictus]|uniref:potassium/sodium hyperpolarization-activated cyclic nucleotide-gated channel 4-like isoform X1 n=2 Tax=Lytechinus pictus TaxID=7653 RepID=UPI0030BA29FF
MANKVTPDTHGEFVKVKKPDPSSKISALRKHYDDRKLSLAKGRRASLPSVMANSQVSREDSLVIDLKNSARAGRRNSLPTKESLFLASGSDFVKKIYRSEKALKDEQKRQQNIRRFVIHPFSNFRWYWDLFMVFLLLVTLVLLPVNVAFFSDDITMYWVTINCISDTLFMVDITLNFFTGVVENAEDTVILDRKKIIIRYLRGWFLLDLISSFPFDYIYLFLKNVDFRSHTALALRILRLTKVLSLLRLLRLSRLLRYIHRLEELLNVETAVIRIVHLVFVMLLLMHWNGCIQFLVPFFQNFPPDCWVVINGLENADKIEQYSWSFFKAICHMISIGFGRFPPMNVTEMWMTTFSIMLGATFYALFIGTMSSLLLAVDASGRLYNERLNQVKEYLRYRKVPMKTQRRVLSYYEHRYQRKYFNEKTILQEQSHPIRREILQHHFNNFITKVNFLNEADPDFAYDVIEKLSFEVFLEGDVIIKAGSLGGAMYFIEHGTVEVWVDDRVVNRLSDGDHFGEISLLIDERRVASIVAATTCDVFCLCREDFSKVLKEYPEMGARMAEIAQERLNTIDSTLDTVAEEATGSESETPNDNNNHAGQNDKKAKKNDSATPQKKDNKQKINDWLKENFAQKL